MSAISSLGNSAPALNHLLQALANKQPAKPTTPVASQANKSAGNDPDHDGDRDGGGINTAA
jgi:hypothetical protein